MLTLAIDCTTEACSVALFGGDKCLAGELRLLGRGHAEQLIPMIADLPGRGHAQRIVVAMGPGSFTGLRVGLAAARALAFAWNAELLGYPTLSLWENLRSWWNIRHLPNVKLYHFNDMKADLAGAVRAIADFLEIRIHKANFPKIVEHCSFDYMKAHAELVVPAADKMWKGGAKTFIHKGTNGRWRDTLSAAEIAAYEARANAELGAACAKWLAHGGQA